MENVPFLKFNPFVSPGSGKTYTMQPLPISAAEDMLEMLQLPAYSSQNFQLWISYFEIYGGKLYDLLNGRKYAFSPLFSPI